MTSTRSKLAISACIFSAAFIGPRSTLAQEPTLVAQESTVVAQEPTPDERPTAYVGLELGQSDNLNRDAAETRSDITRIAAGFDTRHEGNRLRGSLVGDLQFAKYGADLPDDDELLGSVDGQVALHAVPNRFWWDVRYGSGQVRTDPRAPISPENRERTSVTSLGPSIALPLGDRNTFEASAYVSTRRFDGTSELNSDLTTARVGVSRLIDPVTRVAVRFEQSRNEFDVQPESYRFKTAMLEYRRELASGEAAVSAGRGRVEIGGDADATWVMRLNWSRALGSRSRLTLWGGRELTDAGQLFATGGFSGSAPDVSGLPSLPQGVDGRLQGVILSRSPLRRRSAGASFEMGSERGRFNVSLSAFEDEFENEPSLDNDSTSVTAGGSRRLNPMWQIEGYVTVLAQEYGEIAAESEDQFLRLTVSRRLARSSSLGFSLERNRRVDAADAFDENAAFVTLRRDFGRE